MGDSATLETLGGRSLIGSSDGASGGDKFYAINPADASQLEPAFASATLAELDRAAQLASEAFDSYRALSTKSRADFLRDIAARVEKIGEALVSHATAETGLPAARIQSETGRTCNQLRLFADLVAEGSWVGARIDPALPDRKPLPRPDIRSMLRPLGPVAVFAASNFPLAFSVAGGDTASALAAGCPVIAKAHPSHPGTSELVGRAIRESVQHCGLHQGVFSLLFDSGTAIGTALVQHPAIKAVGFTGSRAGGRALMAAAAKRLEPIPFYAEMSSTNPVFILPGAMRERGEQIAAGLHTSMTLGAGQFCTKPGLVMLLSGVPPQFEQRLAELVAASPAFTMLNRGICATYRTGVQKRSGTVRLVAAGKDDDGAGLHSAAALFETAASDFLRDPELAEELFGPATLLIQSDNRNQLLEMARRLDGHLTATIHGTDQDLAEYRDLLAILETKVGRIIFNGFPTGVEVSHAMVHGGPWPSTSDSRTTSVGTMAILRFARPVCYQGFPEQSLPPELQNANPLAIWRMLDGELTRKGI